MPRLNSTRRNASVDEAGRWRAIPLAQLGRKWLCMPLVMGAVVLLAAPRSSISSPLALLAIWAPFSLLVASFATLAGEATQQVLRANSIAGMGRRA